VHLDNAKIKSVCILFVAPILAEFAFLEFGSALAVPQSRFFFERGATGWMALMSLYYGSIVGAANVCIYLFIRRDFNSVKVRFILASTLFCLVAVILFSNRDNGIFVDKTIEELGLALSTVVPKFVPKDDPVPSGYTGVLPPNSRLVFTLDWGRVTIDAYSGLLRRICWDGDCRSLELRPENIGYARSLSFPGPGEHGPDLEWKSNSGIIRCQYSEDVLDFPNVGQALAMFYEPGKVDKLYTKDGLAVECFKAKQSSRLVVQITQILIAGKRPTNLMGSDDSRIHLLYKK